MNKSISPQKTTDASASGDQPESARPSHYKEVRPSGDNEPADSRPPENSITHNGSANAFDATEEARDDEDSDEDNDDFARDYK